MASVKGGKPKTVTFKRVDVRTTSEQTDVEEKDGCTEEDVSKLYQEVGY